MFLGHTVAASSRALKSGTSGGVLLYKSKIFSNLALAITAALAIGAHAKPVHAKNDSTAKIRGTRSLASLAPVRAKSQGEVMLSTLKSTSPRFLSSDDGRGPASVRLAGVCRSALGAAYVSAVQLSSYENCLAGQTSRSGSVDTYWGTAQRQAGIGFSVGK